MSHTTTSFGPMSSAGLTVTAPLLATMCKTDACISLASVSQLQRRFIWMDSWSASGTVPHSKTRNFHDSRENKSWPVPGEGEHWTVFTQYPVTIFRGAQRPYPSFFGSAIWVKSEPNLIYLSKIWVKTRPKKRVFATYPVSRQKCVFGLVWFGHDYGLWSKVKLSIW